MIMMLRFLLPFLYCLLAGSAWALIFGKSFLDSLAPAFMAHIVLVLLSGLLFQRLSFGVYGGLFFLIVSFVIIVCKQRKDHKKKSLRSMMTQEWTKGLFLFCIIYLFVFLTNDGKRFLYYDEFTHWGLFLKESMRLDALYCMSPFSFAHKDYVPATTLFEVIWCRLCAGFSETDAYRAIQMLMFSMLMPMLRPFLANRDLPEDNGTRALIKNWYKQLSGLAFIIMVPLLFLGNQHFFYHSVYCDMFMGVAFFYCVLHVYQNEFNSVCDTITLTLGCVTMVMSKMIGMAFFPFIVLYLIVKKYPLLSGKKRKAWLLSNTAPLVGVPFLLWFWFNRFVDAYIPNAGFRQSYDGIRPDKILEVFGLTSGQTISHLSQVRDAYFTALLKSPVFLKFSYIIVFLVSVILVFIMARIQTGKQRKENRLTGIILLLAGAFYALLMYFLYATAFSEEEALRLASFGRYMSSFALGIALWVVSVYFHSMLGKTDRKGLVYKVLLFAGIILLSLYPYHARCLLPGTLAGDEEVASQYDSYANRISESVPDDASVFMIQRGDRDDLWVKMRYYASPHVTWAESPGPPTDKEDVWSDDYMPSDFVELVSGYDYLYLIHIDDAFLNRYGQCFTDVGKLTDGAIYKQTIVDGKIILE